MKDIFYYSAIENAIKLKRLIMCTTLKKLCGLSAEQVLELCGELNCPIDICKVLKTLGVKYSPMDFSDLELSNPEIIEKKGQILGAVTLVDNDVNIFYSCDKRLNTDNRVRFTLAHELAHCCLHSDALQENGHVEYRLDEISNEPHEILANIFAGKILIPKEMLLKRYKDMVVPLSDLLAEDFSVSQSVMEARLDYLGLPYYSFKNKKTEFGSC